MWLSPANAGSAAHSFPEFEDLSPEPREHLCCFWAGVSINLEAGEARRTEKSWYKFLHHRARQVREHSIRIRVRLDETTPPAITTQEPIVSECARFLLAARDHRLCNALELIELFLVDCEIDGEAHHVLVHVQLLLN